MSWVDCSKLWDHILKKLGGQIVQYDRLLFRDFGASSVKSLTSYNVFAALLWTAPELMTSQRAAADGVGLSVGNQGTQKGDVYSFAIILHEILYRAGLFRCVEDSEPTPAKSKSTFT